MCLRAGPLLKAPPPILSLITCSRWQAPQYLKYQVTLDQLNRAVAAMNATYGPEARAAAAAGTITASGELTVTEEALSEVLGGVAAADGGIPMPAAKTLVLGLHKLQRLRMERARGLVHLAMACMP